MHEPEGQRNGIIVLVSFIGVLGIVVTLIAGNAYFQHVRHEIHREQFLSRDSPDLKNLRVREATVLNAYAWVDEEAGRVRIPIERAMELVVLERQARGAESGDE